VRTARPHSPLTLWVLAAGAAALLLFFTPVAHAQAASSARGASFGASGLDAKAREAILDCTFEVLSYMHDGRVPGRARDESARAPEATRASEARSTSGASEAFRAAPEAVPLVRVAGTAFCFDEGQLASAAHIFDQVLGSRFDLPFVRDRAGNTYPVEKILRYSMRDDFVVFTVAGLPPRPARPHAMLDPARDNTAPLYLAWRKGDGEIAFRKTRYRGASTVETLGREGWIAFGPAPDHGASGAALLDSAARVVGLVNSRSSYRANAVAYAVPIATVEAASPREADIAMRDPLRLLDMPSEQNMPLLGGIPLPAPYERFDRHMAEVRRTYFAYTLPYSLSLAGAGAPMSDVERMQLCEALGPGYCDAQMKTRIQKLPRRCAVRWRGLGAALVECRGDAEAVTLAAASTGRASLGAPAPCTPEDPLEPLPETGTFTDKTGATWQTRSWSVRGCDWTVISMARPVANGTLAFVRGAPSAYAEAATLQLKTLTTIQCESCASPKSTDAVLAEVRDRRDDRSR
jgi:hypothetical protein